MTQEVWCDPPTVPLLQWLARGSLKQNLAQAVRLWVWLHLLYGNHQVCLSLPEPFSYATWRDAFFCDRHPNSDAKPALHSKTCPCAKTVAAWLFAPSLRMTQRDWEQYLTDPAHHAQVQEQIRQFKTALDHHDASPHDIEAFLHQTRLFAVTRRTLAGDLHTLADIQWLKRMGSDYHRVSTWPTRPIATGQEFHSAQLVARDLAFLTQPDLAAIADSLSQDIQGQRRFFVHVDYVVAQERIDWVDDWQAVLRCIWQQNPVPPVRLEFLPAGGAEPCALVIYPVCIYYYRRGPYLCGFGETPAEPSDRPHWRPHWLNYRLDRIQALNPLDWHDPSVPKPLLSAFESNSLPTPDLIQAWMAEAWGFDYYQPPQVLVLRFDQEWDRRYIRNSLRHETFQPIDYEAIAPLIRQEVQGDDQKALLTLWRSRPPTDAYYQALYRKDDPNVRQRLRAWRPHVEVLLPWDLRQRMKAEIRQEAEFYER